LWSITLNPDLVAPQLAGLDIQLAHYNKEFFSDLPPAAQKAAVDIRKTMKSENDDLAHENSYSHWSDLFRAAVLFKEGGVYTDLDSIWLRPITEVGTTTTWIPRTQSWQADLDPKDTVLEGETRYFLEGGIMRFDEPGNEFLWNVLETFPAYDKTMAECWACVGPRQLVHSYNRLTTNLPELVDSEQVFGVRHYRNFFWQYVCRV